MSVRLSASRRAPLAMAAAALLLAALYAFNTLADYGPPSVDAVTDPALTATPVPLDPTNPARTRIGALSFRGALHLTSPDPRFGGISGLATNGQGQFLAITDTGNWFSFQTLETDGRLTGITAAALAPQVSIFGRPPRDKPEGDAEALVWDPATGAATIVYEQTHRFVHWHGIDPARPETLVRPAHAMEYWAAMRRWPSNGGAEAYVTGQLATAKGVAGPRFRLVISEDLMASPRAHLALVSLDGAEPRQIAIPAIPEHRPTEAALLAPDRMLVLHRRYNLKGSGVALTLVDLAPLAIGATRLPARELARWEAPLTLDNMEAMAVVHTATGPELYLMSDDNQRSAQRTLLMKFALDPQP